MARPVYGYQFYDDRPVTAVGVLLPFNANAHGRSQISNYASGSSNAAGVFVSSYSTREQVTSNIINLLLTQKGERVMQPNFGTNIKSILFEQTTDDLPGDLSASVEEDIATWLPYVTIIDSNIRVSADRHTISLYFVFQVETIGANVRINLLVNENGSIEAIPEGQ